LTIIKELLALDGDEVRSEVDHQEEAGAHDCNTPIEALVHFAQLFV
jgi:hypothetical protein